MVIGGKVDNEPSKTVDVHDLCRNMWQPLAQELNHGRVNTAACVVGSHVYVVAGRIT